MNEEEIQEGQYGIKESKEALIFIGRLGTFIGEFIKTGDISGAIPELIKVLTSAMPAFEDANLIPKEASEYSDAEKAELIATFKQELELDDDKAEGAIEDALPILLALNDYVRKYFA